MSEKIKNADEKPNLIKINKWDSTAVKHALDDNVKNALLDYPNCKEYHGLIDGRLFISIVSVCIALYALAWDYLYPFPISRPVLIICVPSYFIMMGIFTLYTTYKEKGIFAVVIQNDGNNRKVWEASSEMKKYDDKYTLTLSVKDSKSLRKVSITKSCACYIDVNGLVLENLVTNEVDGLYKSLLNEEKDK